MSGFANYHESKTTQETPETKAAEMFQLSLFLARRDTTENEQNKPEICVRFLVLPKVTSHQVSIVRPKQNHIHRQAGAAPREVEEQETR